MNGTVSIRSRSHARGLVGCWIVCAVGLGGWPIPTLAQEAPQVYQVSGEATLEVKGDRSRSGWGWRHEVPARFTGELQLGSGGMARLTNVSIRAGDVTVSRGRRAMHLRCNRATTSGPVVGTLDGVGNLLFPRDAATLLVASSGDRGPRGECPGRGDALRLAATNNDVLYGRHDPVADVFQLAGTFRTTYDGELIQIDVTGEGRYDNRPPVAALGVEGEGIARAQGGCPPITGLNPASVEANDRLGLRLHLQSNSSDPDDAFAGSDLALAQWQQWSGTPVGPPAGTYRFLGRGRRIGPVLFELDQHHTLSLRVTDRRGASDTTSCGFFVADTTPPDITPPRPLAVECTIPGGATPGTSESIRRFLATARADDLTDPSPTALPPRVRGLAVAETTLFPVGELTQVSFRYRDRHGNVGEEWSSVEVTRGSPIDLGLGRRVIPGHGDWIEIKPRIRTGGPCDFKRLYLVSILTDGLEAPHEFARGVAFGSDDREFELRALPLTRSDGELGSRRYELVWIGIDDAGRKARLVETLVVEPPGKGE